MRVARRAGSHTATSATPLKTSGTIVNTTGSLAVTPNNRLAITRVTLKPVTRFSGGKLPNREELDHLHHLAHEDCFIASSVKTEIICEPRIAE